MKKQDITYQEKLNELRLDISHPNSKGFVFVFLEGESDIRLFRKLFDLNNCKVETIPGGNPKLEECVSELLKAYPLVIGIRDADFIHLRVKPYTKQNMFLTDLHDMEMILVSEDDVFSAFMFEYSNFSKDEHTEIRNNIISTIEQISLLKYLNYKENLGFEIKSGFQDLISFEKFEIDFNNFFSRILSKSQNALEKDISIILQKLNSIKDIKPEPFQVCNGHDFMKGLSKFIKEKGDGRTLSDDDISSSFRMTFTIDHFKKTQLFCITNKWAGDNKCSIYT